MIKKVIQSFSNKARTSRGELFQHFLTPTNGDKILDLGGGSGAHLASLIWHRENVWVADIDSNDLEEAERSFGFKTKMLNENGRLPFQDQEFDIVFCSSVIEHVTLEKAELYNIASSQKFAEQAFSRQKEFAKEIQRIGKRYFIQTPYRYFLVESHSWQPVIFVFLPRNWQIKIITFFNKFWPKKTIPDFNLLTKKQLKALFPEAEIVEEKFLGMTKSIMAIKQ